jgi:filamentous hemagglutinin
VVNDLADYNKSKTTGFNFSTSINTGAFKSGEAGQSPTGQTTIGGQYYGHDTEQITRATLGGGAIIVGGKTLTENNAAELGLSGLNRDVSKAQEITVDKDIGGLNASVTIDNRLLTSKGRASIGDDFSNSGKNWQIVSNGLESDIQMISVDIAPSFVASGLKGIDELSFGLLPFDSADHGGLLAQLPIMLGVNDINQKQYTVVSKDSDYAKAHPELFMPASELPGYADLAKEGKADLDNKLVSREPVVINKGTATFQNFTNGMMNTLAEAVVNGGEQTSSDVFTLNYNPRHGFLADILEIGTDKMGITVTGALKPVSAYTGIDFGFSSGVAQGTGEFMLQVMQMRGDAGANFAAHSQGNILTQAGLLGVSLQGVDLTHAGTINGVDGKLPNFSVSSYGSPVNNMDMSDTLRSMGVLYSTSVANPGDFVAKFLGGNTGTYRAADPALSSIESAVIPFFSKVRWTEGGNPLDLLFGDKYPEKNTQGKTTNWLSPHSSYVCTGICGDTAHGRGNNGFPFVLFHTGAVFGGLQFIAKESRPQQTLCTLFSSQ